ncbi:histone deacetylase family protein [Sphingomonas baiyangensis]|uniref:Histone deacetylase n=1 Tax=Sphingomonas baiyangensis TaxID=2572576 RepID=A0A4U1L530_9SPHN|nr:histone deacetylase [Sphingomonas baiyangensis]TKD51305.1 histone deacetylase [Sphingomonas baiyangensis]
MIAVVHHPAYVAPAPSRSGYQWNKNGLVRDLLLQSTAVLTWHEPEPMPRHWIEAVHCPDYVAEVIEARVPAQKERRIGFAVTPAVAERALAVPGGTHAAAMLALHHGFAANTAGGSHHALAESGAGYCVFNDLAIAAHRLVAERDAGRVLIVDCDVHQGDGTAALTAGHPSIATYSIHAEKNFPARKARSTLDVPLRDGVGDDEYLAILAATLLPLIDDFAPDLLLYQAGVDPFAGDRLGRLALTHDGLARRDGWIARIAAERGLPLASALGGGYGHDAGEVAARHVASILALGTGYARACAGTAAGAGGSRTMQPPSAQP